MKTNPYLMYNGQCETAFKFYEKCLGGKIDCLFTYAEAPAPNECAKESLGQIMHARFVMGDTVLMGSDCPPSRYEKPQGFAISIGITEPAEADRVFAAMSENGTVTMPIAETFWARRFGMLVDQFGIPWMINCEKPMA